MFRAHSKYIYHSLSQQSNFLQNMVIKRRWVHVMAVPLSPFRCINMGLHKHSCCTGTTVGGPAAVGGSGHVFFFFFLITDASYAVTHQEPGHKRIADLWVLSGCRGGFYVYLSYLYLSQPTTPTPSLGFRRAGSAGTPMQAHKYAGVTVRWRPLDVLTSTDLDFLPKTKRGWSAAADGVFVLVVCSLIIFGNTSQA